MNQTIQKMQGVLGRDLNPGASDCRSTALTTELRQAVAHIYSKLYTLIENMLKYASLQFISMSMVEHTTV